MRKMNKFFSITLTALFGILLLISCDSVNNDNKKDQPEEREILASQIENPDNPFDKEGAIHNDFLDYFGQATAEDTVLDQESILKVIREYYAQNEQEFGEEETAAFARLFEGYGELGIAGPIFPRPSDIFCRWFPQLCDIFNPSGPFIPFALKTGSLNPENGSTSTERTLQFAKEVKELETKLLESEEIDGNAKEALLAQYAIARYSAMYWHNVSTQQVKGGYTEEFAEAQAAATCHTCDVVTADAAGAALGSIIPGIGTGVGAGVASAAAVIEKIFW